MGFKQSAQRFFKRFGAFVFIVLISVISLSFVAHIPAVQKFGIQHIASIMSNITGTRVEVGKFHFNFFSSLALFDVHIESPVAEGDTLLFTESLDVKFSNLITLANNRLVVKEVQLRNAYLQFDRPDSLNVSTMTALINNLKSGEDRPDSVSRRSNSLEIIAGSLRGSNINVRYNDDHKNTVQTYHAENINVDFDEVLLDSSIIRLNRAYIDGLTIGIAQSAEPDVEIPKDSLENPNPLLLEIKDFVVDNSHFTLHNLSKGPIEATEGMNYKDLDISDINISVQDFTMCDLNFTGVVKNLACRDKSGFEIKSAVASNAEVSDSGIVLEGLLLKTNGSTIRDNLRFVYSEYADFEDFVNKVYLVGDFNNARISVEDIMMAVPKLRNSAFFDKNADRDIFLTGRVTGNINRLRGRNLDGRLGELAFKGDFRSNNLTVPGEQLLNLRIDEAVLSAQVLRDILPNVALTSQYDNLGRMVFSGRYDGFFNDFVAYGEVISEIGSATLDMRLNITEGAARAQYSGGIGLDSFDIGAWTSNPVFGKITTSMQILRGQGLTAESANAEVRGGIQSLGFKGYQYQNVVMNGLLDENYFSGELEIVDRNIDLAFIGTVDLRGEDPRFDFHAIIDGMDLHALNLVKDSIMIAGNFEVAGKVTPEQGIDGYARASAVDVSRGQLEKYSLDTISILSQPEGNENHYRIVSDYISGRIDGEMYAASVYPQLAEFLNVNYPALFGNIEFKKDTTIVPGKFDFDISLTNPAEWSGIFGIKDLDFETLAMQGEFNLESERLELVVGAPYVKQGQLGVENLNASFILTDQSLTTDVGVDSLMINDYAIDSIAFYSVAGDRKMRWSFGVKNMFDSLRMDLIGNFYYDSLGNYVVTIDPDRSEIFDAGWKVNMGNTVEWGRDYFEIDSFSLQKGDRLIALNDIDRKGLHLDVENFDAHYLDAVWDYEKLDFYGSYYLDLRIEDLFQESRKQLDLQMEDLVINGDSYGPLMVKGFTEGRKQAFGIEAGIGEPGSEVLEVNGSYDPKITDGKNLNVAIDLNDFPARFLEYFLGESISNTVGVANGQLVFSGDTSSIYMDGLAHVTGAATTVDVLGVRYSLQDFDVPISSDYIDLSNAIVVDPRGNTGIVEGGLRHELMKDLTLDLRLTSPEILGIDLPKSRDAVFYGTGIGSAEVVFTGLTREPTMVVNTTTAEGTQIYMPLDQGTGANGEDFLRFVSRDSMGNIVDEIEQEVITGIDLQVNIDITPEAQVDMIFDENTRDILRGSGEGSIQLNLSRAGDLTVYGGVEVESGNYLFTSFAVNKPFVIRQGGTIRWTGDPYEAELNIIADYQGTRASLTALLEEYLLNASANAQSVARSLTQVNLEMILTGSLQKPTINFDIKFPDVTGELAGYVDSKMKTLQNDPGQLNQQVFAVLLAGTFLPANNTSGNNFAQAAAWNTVSEFISSQLSFFVSDFLSGAIEDVDFISGIDFDVGYNQNYDLLSSTTGGTGQTYQEWEVHVRNRLFDDRFVVDVGGSYVVDNPVATQGAYLTQDYALEYMLTRDRRLKVRFYHRRNEQTIEGFRSRSGIGLSYRRDFDNFGDWLRGLEKEARNVRDQAKATRDGEQQGPSMN